MSNHEHSHDHDHHDGHDHGHDHDHGYTANHTQHGVRHVLEFVVSPESMSARVDAVAALFRDRARVAGFRRGKAPLAMVRKQFADDIRQRVLDDAIPETLSHELGHLGLQPLDTPQLDRVEFDSGGPLSFAVSFDTVPEISLGKLDFAVERQQPGVTDEMVQEAMQDLQQRFARLVPVAPGEAVAAGQFARCELSLLSRDGKGRRLAEENRFVRVGEERSLPALNEALVGMQVGQEKEVAVTVAEGHPNALVAGKELTCRVRVDELKERTLPNLDDDFARDLGLESLEDLRSRTRQDLDANLQQQADRRVETDLLAAFREANPVEVPESLLERRLDEMVRRFAQDLAQQGIDPRNAVDWGAFRRDQQTAAAHGLAEEMLLDALARDEGIELDDDAVVAEIRSHWERSEGGKSRPLASIVQQMRKEGAFENLRLTMRRRSALERLKARASIGSDGGDDASR